MVMGAFERHVFGPRRKAMKQAEELAEKVAEERAEIRAWNERRLAAAARGEPFDEPLPIDDGMDTGR